MSQPRIVRQLPGQYFVCSEGRYWVMNPQRGYVEVSSSSRGVQHALARAKWEGSLVRVTSRPENYPPGQKGGPELFRVLELDSDGERALVIQVSQVTYQGIGNKFRLSLHRMVQNEGRAR